MCVMNHFGSFQNVDYDSEVGGYKFAFSGEDNSISLRPHPEQEGN